MNKKLFVLFLILGIFPIAIAAEELFLPFSNSSYFLSQGYNSLPTHINKDFYALDFVQNGCEAYGKPVSSVLDGKVTRVDDKEDTYGIFVDIEHTGGLKSKYAHLKESIVSVGQAVKKGQVIGYIGNTGKVISTNNSCPEHSGTHLHFRITQIQPDGSQIAYKPEPLSGYTDLAVGNWYKSDNNLAINDPPPEPVKKSWAQSLWDKIKVAFSNFFNNDTAINKVGANVSDSMANTSSESSNLIENVLPINSVEASNNPSEVESADEVIPVKIAQIPESNNSLPVNNPAPTEANSVQIIPGFGGGAAPAAPTNNQHSSGDSGGSTEGEQSDSSDSVLDNESATSTATSTIIQTSAPKILLPNSPAKFATTTIEFSGKADPSSAVFAEGFDDLAIADESGSWNLKMILPEGTSTLNFLALNPNEATSSAETVNVFVDTTPPIANLSIAECQFTIANDGCLIMLATSTLNIDLSEEAHSEIFVDGVLSFEMDGVSTSTPVSLAEGEYEIYAVSKDELGNIGTSTTIKFEYFARPIIINEIAWAGTEVSASNEWIELYNRSDKTLKMENLKLKALDGAPSFNMKGLLPPGGYYLIERTDDDTVPTIPADMVTPFSGEGDGSGLSNEGEELEILSDISGNSFLIDSTPPVSACGGWCFGSSSLKSTMARKSTRNVGNLPSNWQDDPNTYYPIFNAVGVEIGGTPKAANDSNFFPTY